MSTTILAIACALAAQLPPELAHFQTTCTGNPAYVESVPIGNGRLGAVVECGRWLVEVDLSHTDAWSECARVLDLGRIEIEIQPPHAGDFQRALRLDEGRLETSDRSPGHDLALEIFVEPDRDVLHVVGRGKKVGFVTVHHWSSREKHALRGEELASSWAMHDAPASVEVVESGDVVVPELVDQLAWYHRNETSIVPLTLAHQGLAEFAPVAVDPLLHRTSGVWIESTGFARYSDTSYGSGGDLGDETFHIRVAASCAITKDVATWIAGVRRISAESIDADAARARTAAWWREHWSRSRLVVTPREGAPALGDPRRITEAYALQRWMTTCAARGESPIHFNGSIFTPDPAKVGGPALGADWRKWGGDYWWQNTRLPYLALLARGDGAFLDPLYRLYERNRPLCEARAKAYHGASGAYFPETMTVFGTYSNGDYGWDRTGLDRNVVQCPWWQWSWQQGLELVDLMLDDHAHMQSDAFARTRLVPMADSVLRWFDTRFARDEHGILVITPTQALETYWHGVVDDTPCVAGLRRVTERLLALPEPVSSAESRALWKRMRDACPPIPVRDFALESGTERRIAPAAQYEPQRSNVENPELYAVHPFREYGVGRPDLELARATFRARASRASVGWAQDGIVAARLGLADEAAADVIARVGNSHPAFRFPAMWGPNYDWIPDQCHGANLMATLQEMVLQSDGDAIHLLPAWPAAWDVSFRLHAPRGTVIDGVWKSGKWAKLDVTPESRRKDVVLHVVEAEGR